MNVPPRLARSGYDRAAQHRTDDAWLKDAFLRSRVLVVTASARTPIARANGKVALQLRNPDSVDQDAPRRFLGMVDGVPHFAVTVAEDDSGWAGLREFGADADDLQAGLLASAVALENWHDRHHRCSVCGTETVETHAGWIRSCPVDGTEHFPRTDPAVIMVVHDGGDRCLLGRGVNWGPGRFSTLAGFVEPGESLEAAVAREVHEEVGIDLTDIRYVASQPWPFPSSLMVGFVARVDGDPTLHADTVEVAEADWFTRDEVRRAARWSDAHLEPDPAAKLRGISPPLSISRYLIDGWLDGTLH